MTTSDTPPPPKIGAAPDSGAARIMRAAIEAVSAEGLAGLTADSLCSRAGATRSEFDQRWSDPFDAFADAIDELMTLPHLPDTGRLQDDLAAYAAAYLDRCSDPAFVASLVYISAQAKSEQLWAKLMPGFLRRREVNCGLIERAVARGEIHPDTDPDPVLDRVLGLSLCWMTTGHSPTPEEIEVAIRDLLVRELGLSSALLH
jgi:hypothetical protein